MKNVLLVLGAAMMMAMSAASCSESGGETTGEKTADTIRIDSDGADKAVKYYANAKMISLNTAEYCNKVAAMDAPEKYLGSEPAIVDFWASWCGPCMKLAPVLEQLSGETGITIYKIDVDQNGDLAGAYNIKYIPALYYCNDGKVTYIPNEGDNYSLELLKALVQ